MLIGNHNNRSLASEPLFKQMLYLERKRSERTGEPFALMLVDADVDELDSRILEKIGGKIASATRETDITGWHQYPRAIGVIFTILNGSKRDAIQSAILQKVRTAIRESNGLIQLNKIQISFHFFPEDGKSGRPTGTSNDVLYPELRRRDLSQKLFVALKRLIDVSASFAALILLSPLFLLICFLIRLTSAGPALFKQRRVGQYGREFTFLKFRSMHVNNNSAIHRNYVRELIRGNVGQDAGTYKIKNDPRVTSIGGFLRKSSLDELPQFINVLKGDMSLVGPRPPIPYEFECYALWHRHRIYLAKPGITGLWQVNGRSRTTFDDMVRLDLQYIREQSLFLDFKILLRTPLAVLSGEGAH